MKITLVDDKIIVFLSKNSFKIDYNNSKELKEKLEKLIYKLQKKCNFLNGVFYNIDVYFDKFYGSILEITTDDNYYDYFKNIDIQVNIIESKFLYEIDYSFLDYFKIPYYKYNSKFYLELDNQIDNILLGKIIEYSNVIYGNNINDIKKNSKKVQYEKAICSPSGKT